MESGQTEVLNVVVMSSTEKDVGNRDYIRKNLQDYAMLGEPRRN